MCFAHRLFTMRKYVNIFDYMLRKDILSGIP